MKRVNLPSSLRFLTFGFNLNKNLEQVTLPSSQNLEQVTPPSSIRSLTFGHSFNQTLEGVTLQGNLQSLTFGHDFNRSLEQVTLPCNFQSLTFGEGLNWSPKRVVLPRNLQCLTLLLECKGCNRRSDLAKHSAELWHLATFSAKALEKWDFYAVFRAWHVGTVSKCQPGLWRSELVLQSSDCLILFRVSSLCLACSKMGGGKTHAAIGNPSCSAYLQVCWWTISVCVCFLEHCCLQVVFQVCPSHVLRTLSSPHLGSLGYIIYIIYITIYIYDNCSRYTVYRVMDLFLWPSMEEFVERCEPVCFWCVFELPIFCLAETCMNHQKPMYLY